MNPVEPPEAAHSLKGRTPEGAAANGDVNGSPMTTVSRSVLGS